MPADAVLEGDDRLDTIGCVHHRTHLGGALARSLDDAVLEGQAMRKDEVEDQAYAPEAEPVAYGETAEMSDEELLGASTLAKLEARKVDEVVETAEETSEDTEAEVVPEVAVETEAEAEVVTEVEAEAETEEKADEAVETDEEETKEDEA